MAIGYIYCITNRNNNKQYVGMTTRSIERRFAEHCEADTYIGKAIRKHGIHSFDVQLLEVADSREELIEKEIYWIKKLQTFGKGYNLTRGGDGVDNGERLEVKLTDKQKRFVSWVREQNKKRIDVVNAQELIPNLLINMMEIFLIAERPKDKKRAAKMILNLKKEYLIKILKQEVIDLEELKKFAV